MSRVPLALLALATLYLLFAGQASPDELAFGALCVALAGAWGAAVVRASPKTLHFEREAVGAMLSAVAALPDRTAQTGVALVRASLRGDLEGGVRARDFKHGRDSDEAASGRRAVVVLALSLTPDSFVIAVPPERNEIALHQLIASPDRGDARWPA